MYQLRLLAGNLHHLLGIEFFKHLINSRARVPTYTYLNHRVIAEPGLEASWWVHSLRTSSTALLKHLTYRHNPKLRPEQHTPQFPSVFLCQSHNSNTRIRHLLSWPPYKPTSTLSVRGSPRKVLFNYTSRPKKSYYKENQIKWEKKIGWLRAPWSWRCSEAMHLMKSVSQFAVPFPLATLHHICTVAQRLLVFPKDTWGTISFSLPPEGPHLATLSLLKETKIPKY